MKKLKLKESGKRLLTDLKAYGPAGIIFLVYYGIVHLTHSAFCPLLRLTGVPCAGCGLTRAFLFLLHGEFARAAYINPMAYALLAVLLYCAYFRYIRGSKIKEFRILLTCLVTVMLIFYVIRMYLYFPDRVPYVYMPDNILDNHIPGYEELIYRFIGVLRKLRG